MKNQAFTQHHDVASDNRRYEGYTIFNMWGTNSTKQLPLLVTFSADHIYNVGAAEYDKPRKGYHHRFLPQRIEQILRATECICTSMSVDELFSKFDDSLIIMEAIHLTNTPSIYVTPDYYIEYQLVRYMYNYEIDDYYMEQLIDQYPEKLI